MWRRTRRSKTQQRGYFASICAVLQRRLCIGFSLRLTHSDFRPGCSSCIYGLGRRIFRLPIGHNGQGCLLIIIYFALSAPQRWKKRDREAAITARRSWINARVNFHLRGKGCCEKKRAGRGGCVHGCRGCVCSRSVLVMDDGL